jgi:peptide chain release factor subunit 1
VALRDRLVVDRTPYTSPLATMLAEYERFAVIVADHKHARIFDYFMGGIAELEALKDDEVEAKHSGAFKGLEQTRREHHHEYSLHRHLQRVADRLFAHHKRASFDKVVLAGLPDNVSKLERCLHAYLKQKVVAREQWAHDLAREDVRKRTLEIERGIEATKERKLLALVRDHVCGDLLATTGLDETFRALYYGKVATLVVEEGMTLRGRECPECRYLFPRAEDAKDASALVPCPLCNRPTRAVPDIIDQAAELAMLSGAKVEHIQHAKDELAALGRTCSILRFR